jgi:hypothetical protein
MSQLDRTHDHSPDFDQSLQAVLGLARLLSQVEALHPATDAAGSSLAPGGPSSSSTGHDPALLAVLGVVAVASELRPMIEALRTGSPLHLNVGTPAAQDGEIERISPEVDGGARPTLVGRAGLLR